MVTRVLDADGTVIHDCRQAGCVTSWDGYNIADGTAVEGRTDHGDEWEPVDEHTVKRVVRP